MSSSTVEYEAKALYDYDAKSDSELTLRVGQVVRVVEEFDTGWFVVECAFVSVVATAMRCSALRCDRLRLIAAVNAFHVVVCDRFPFFFFPF
jgi:hypothetical protein